MKRSKAQLIASGVDPDQILTGTQTPDAGSEKTQYYIPGFLWTKVLFLAVMGMVFLVGVGYVWLPLDRLFNGSVAEARINRIVQARPGARDLIINWRQEWKDTKDMSIRFHHYAVVNREGRDIQLRLGTNARQKPLYNVNDTLVVAFKEGDPVAYPIKSWSTWSYGIIYLLLGGQGVFISSILILNARKPIEVDKEDAEELRRMDEGE